MSGGRIICLPGHMGTGSTEVDYGEEPRRWEGGSWGNIRQTQREGLSPRGGDACPHVGAAPSPRRTRKEQEREVKSTWGTRDSSLPRPFILTAPSTESKVHRRF